MAPTASALGPQEEGPATGRQALRVVVDAFAQGLGAGLLHLPTTERGHHQTCHAGGPDEGQENGHMVKGLLRRARAGAWPALAVVAAAIAGFSFVSQRQQISELQDEVAQVRSAVPDDPSFDLSDLSGSLDELRGQLEELDSRLGSAEASIDEVGGKAADAAGEADTAQVRAREAGSAVDDLVGTVENIRLALAREGIFVPR